MRFIQNGFHALLALSTIVSSVVGAPVDGQQSGDVYIAADDALPQLSPRGADVLIAADDALPQLTGKDVNTVNLTKRQNPPTYQDFVNFFNTQQDQRGLMVFWSGVGVEESQNFARAFGRKTLEMLIGDRWLFFQRDKVQYGDNGYWDSFEDAVTGFWDKASQACAEFARVEVYVYMTREMLEDQTRPDCPKCWYRMEKPALIAGYHAQPQRVTRIAKWVYPYTPGNEPIGLITDMSNKI